MSTSNLLTASAINRTPSIFIIICIVNAIRYVEFLTNDVNSALSTFGNGSTFFRTKPFKLIKINHLLRFLMIGLMPHFADLL